MPCMILLSKALVTFVSLRHKEEIILLIAGSDDLSSVPVDNGLLLVNTG